MSFRLVPKSVTLNDLEQRNGDTREVTPYVLRCDCENSLAYLLFIVLYVILEAY